MYCNTKNVQMRSLEVANVGYTRTAKHLPSRELFLTYKVKFAGLGGGVPSTVCQASPSGKV